MQVIKFSGEVEKFNPKKIYATIKEAGGSSEIAKEAINEVRKKYHKDMTTKEILKITLEILKKEPGVSQRYNLKEAIMKLGPTGFPFEKFIARILEYYEYKTETDVKLKGKRIYHEVDIVATKKKKFMIECKYHNEAGTITRLHPAMYTYARFLDLKKHKFDQGWLITNTKCSPDAKNYSEGVNLKLTTWKYPEKESLQKLIEKNNLYPVTILEISEKRKEKLLENNIVILKDFQKYSVSDLMKKLKFTEEEATYTLKQVNEIMAL